jgi:hypothetical protein
VICSGPADPVLTLDVDDRIGLTADDVDRLATAVYLDMEST